MAYASSIMPNSLKTVEWMWKSNPNPFSKSEPEEWSHYSDVENLIIEEEFSNKKSEAQLDDYYIDFKHYLQILNKDHSKQRPIKRVVRNREDKHLRETRFVDLPVDSARSFGGLYGWISPFIIEVRRALGLQKGKLPSKNPTIIPMLVEKAAEGIIEEGKSMGKEQEAKKLAKMLREKKNEKIEVVWKCCIYIYTLESFLYKIVNSTMRLIGDKKHEQDWQSKIGTLGPFCLLLWDDPINRKTVTNKTLYRGANLEPEQIATYQNMANNENEYGSFQAFSSCSRNRQLAEEFGNTLFIMKVDVAFIADISQLSEYPEEEEELITPGVCFHVQRVELDPKKNKHLIYLRLRQQFKGKKKKIFLNDVY